MCQKLVALYLTPCDVAFNGNQSELCLLVLGCHKPSKACCVQSLGLLQAYLQNLKLRSTGGQALASLYPHPSYAPPSPRAHPQPPILNGSQKTTQGLAVRFARTKAFKPSSTWTLHQPASSALTSPPLCASSSLLRPLPAPTWLWCPSVQLLDPL